jgi:hypothetical protein
VNSELNAEQILCSGGRTCVNGVSERFHNPFALLLVIVGKLLGCYQEIHTFRLSRFKSDLRKALQFFDRSLHTRTFIAYVDLHYLLAGDTASVSDIHTDLQDFVSADLISVNLKVLIYKSSVAEAETKRKGGLLTLLVYEPVAMKIAVLYRFCPFVEEWELAF